MAAKKKATAKVRSVTVQGHEALRTWVADVAELVSDKRNARTHSEKNIRAIMASLKRFGQRRNLVVDVSGVVKAGNGTLEAARRLGWKKIVCGPAPETRLDSRAYALADNRTAELAGWDEEILGGEIKHLAGVVEFGSELLGELGFGQSEVAGYLRGVAVPGAIPDVDPPATAITKPGDVWELGDHRLVCGDTRDAAVWKLLLGDEKLQMVWTDPPYGVEIVGGARAVYDPEERKRQGGKTIQNDGVDPTQLRVFLTDALRMMVEQCVRGAPWYVAAPSGDFFGEFAFVLGRECLNVWRHTLIWVKNSLVMGRADYHYRHEAIFYGWVPGAGHYFVDDRTKDSVFEIDRPSRSEEHPTMKPPDLVREHVRNSSKVGWLVGDGFGGSGTTLLVCEQEERRARLVEIDPIYCDVIVKRWELLTSRKAKLVVGGTPKPARRRKAA